MVSPRSTHAVTFLHNWELPFGKGRRYLTNTSKAVDAVAGGWRLSGVNTLYSGIVFTPTISNAPRVNADFNYFRPDIIGSPSVFESKCSSVVQPQPIPHRKRPTAMEMHPRDLCAARRSMSLTVALEGVRHCRE